MPSFQFDVKTVLSWPVFNLGLRGWIERINDALVFHKKERTIELASR